MFYLTPHRRRTSGIRIAAALLLALLAWAPIAADLQPPPTASAADSRAQAEDKPASWLPDLRRVSRPALHALTFAVGLIGGVVPFVINVEVYLIAVLALTGASGWITVLLITIGQVAAKWVLYEAGKGVIHIKWIRRERMDRAKAAFERHGHKTNAVVFASASLGLPPLYGVSLLAGSLRLPLQPFMVLISIGRLLRFGVLALGPYLVGRLT